MTVGRAGESTARDDDAVVVIAAGQSVSNRINSWRRCRIIRSRIEHRLVPPESEVRLEHAVARAVLDHHFRSSTPLVLREGSSEIRAEQGIRLLSNFAVSIKKPERSISYSSIAGGVPVAGVSKGELSILIVRRPGCGAAHVDLVEVIFACPLVQPAKRKRVCADDFDQVIRNVRNHPARVRRIRAAIESCEVSNADRRNFVLDQLACGPKNVREIDAVICTVIQTSR